MPGAEPIVAQDAAVEGGPVKAIHGEGYAASFIGMRADTAWVLVAGTTTPVRVEWSSGWAAVDTRPVAAPRSGLPRRAAPQAAARPPGR